ncbi:unnamed protein product [Lactuca virosa]|uniref:Uncharacterized protein n=1 Tax=Lactuca virosa TaxID=75947 RepID=A0AAU9NXE0_9ASTR|nr:unnamed protein product [Lactuca virosa]
MLKKKSSNREIKDYDLYIRRLCLFHLILTRFIVCTNYQTPLASTTDMSTTVISDAMIIPPTDSQTTEVEFATCDCCGLTEECTPAYIERIRERYDGKWICGLCGEAVKDEIMRSERLMISTEEAMFRHMNFCRMSSSSDPPPNPAVHLITAMRQILRRSLESPRSLRSAPSSPLRHTGSIRLSRSSSCITDLALESSSYTDLQEIGK